MIGTLRSVGVIVALLGGAGVLTSLVGPLYPLLVTAEPSMEGAWRAARKWGIVLVSVGLALVLLSLL
jgi:hypothetical protein